MPLYALAIYGIIRYFHRPKEISQKIQWTPIESVGVTLAIYFGAQLVGALTAFMIPLLMGKSKSDAIDWLDKNTYGQFIFIVLIEVLTIWAIHIFLKRRKANFDTIGLRRRPKWSDLAYLVIAFVCYVVTFIAITTIVKNLAPSLNVNQKQQLGFDNYTQLQLPFIFASLVLLPPIAEELLVRGLLYTGLKNGMKRWLAVIVASGLFGIAHLQAGSGEPLLWIAAIDTFTLSLFLIYLREKTGSLWASIGLHMLKNLIAFLSLFVFRLG